MLYTKVIFYVITASKNRFTVLSHSKDSDSDLEMSLEDKLVKMFASFEKKMEQKIEMMSGILEKKVDNLTALHLETREMASNNFKEILDVKMKVATLETENFVIRKELQLVKESINRREQKDKDLTVRVLGLAVSEEEKKEGNKVSVKLAYDKILRPILVAAKTKNLIDAVPQLYNCLEDGYRMGKGSSDSQGQALPPPIIIRLKSKAVKTALFRCKRDAIPAPSDMEKANGVKNYLLLEDLTVPTLRRLKELKEDTRVQKVWTMEGNIKYTLANKPAFVCKMNSVYKPLEDILK